MRHGFPLASVARFWFFEFSNFFIGPIKSTLEDTGLLCIVIDRHPQIMFPYFKVIENIIDKR